MLPSVDPHIPSVVAVPLAILAVPAAGVIKGSWDDEGSETSVQPLSHPFEVRQ